MFGFPSSMMFDDDYEILRRQQQRAQTPRHHYYQQRDPWRDYYDDYYHPSSRDPYSQHRPAPPQHTQQKRAAQRNQVPQQPSVPSSTATPPRSNRVPIFSRDDPRPPSNKSPRHSPKGRQVTTETIIKLQALVRGFLIRRLKLIPSLSSISKLEGQSKTILERSQQTLDHYNQEYTPLTTKTPSERRTLRRRTEMSLRGDEEELTRMLLQLDNVESRGSAEIREARRQMVRCVQSRLERVDQLKRSFLQRAAVDEKEEAIETERLQLKEQQQQQECEMEDDKDSFDEEDMVVDPLTSTSSTTTTPTPTIDELTSTVMEEEDEQPFTIEEPIEEVVVEPSADQHEEDEEEENEEETEVTSSIDSIDSDFTEATRLVENDEDEDEDDERTPRPVVHSPPSETMSFSESDEDHHSEMDEEDDELHHDESEGGEEAVGTKAKESVTLSMNLDDRQGSRIPSLRRLCYDALQEILAQRSSSSSFSPSSPPTTTSQLPRNVYVC